MSSNANAIDRYPHLQEYLEPQEGKGGVQIIIESLVYAVNQPGEETRWSCCEPDNLHLATPNMPYV
jgi:hypothetical protein